MWVAVVVAVGVLLSTAPSASACPGRSAQDLHARLLAADAAFVGTRVRAGVYRVQVKVRGDLGRRVRVHGLRGCGVPRRAGLLLDRRHGRWVATRAVPPGELLKASGIGP